MDGGIDPNIQAIPTEVLLWVATAVLLAVAEIFTAGFFCMFFAVGAAVAAIVAYAAPDQLWLQWTVFVAASMLTFIFARPLLKRTFGLGPAIPSNAHAISGKDVLVLETVTRHQGRVKLVHTGEVWTAYLDAGASVDALDVDAEGVVVRVDGAKLAVCPK